MEKPADRALFDRRWMGGLQCQEGVWRCPPGWEADEGAKAGNHANPWYGILPANWLDTWCAEQAGGASEYMRGVRVLQRFSSQMVELVGGVWRTAGALWREKEIEDIRSRRCGWLA